MSDYDGMDYEELLDECEWMSDFLSLMAERITKNPDVHNLVDYVRKIEDENKKLNSTIFDTIEGARQRTDENKKLRELVKSAWRCIHTGISCSDCRLVAGGCTLQSAMREFGIEVR